MVPTEVIELGATSQRARADIETLQHLVFEAFKRDHIICVVPWGYEDSPGRVGNDLYLLITRRDLGEAVRSIRAAGESTGFLVVSTSSNYGQGINVRALPIEVAPTGNLNYDTRYLLSVELIGVAVLREMTLVTSVRVSAKRREICRLSLGKNLI